jgi:hypothetical protein
MPYLKITDNDPKTVIGNWDKLLVVDVSDTTMAASGTTKTTMAHRMFSNPPAIDTPAATFSTLQVTSGAYDGAVVMSDDEGNFSFTSYKKRANDIGTPGALGFGLGVCPEASLPIQFTRLPGYNDVDSDNYGNYIHTATGSIVCWIPKFYYRIAHANNPTYGVHALNSIDVKSIYDFASTALANASGYALHRAFIDGGVEQDGFFIDKHTNSSVAYGTGTVAASISFGNPISTDAGHNPIGSLTAGATYGNIYASAIHVAKARDGVNGAINTSSSWHCMSIFQHSAIALLSLAHGQASSSSAACAWYSTTVNFPKGCNNNALKDADDTTVVFQSDGYDNAAKAGSGFPFAKTTHNGQNCGVADLNGNMYNIAIGVTCIASTKAITGASQANPCEITCASHGFLTGQVIMITAVVGMTQLNDKLYTLTSTGGDTFTLDGVNSSGYTLYGSAGTITYGTFYAAKESTAMKTFTASNTTATDHWGATGIAALMEAFTPAFVTAGGGALEQRFGNSATPTNQVFAEDTSGNDYKLTSLGFPVTSSSVNATGVNLFGKDYFYQYIRNELCALCGCHWSSSAAAGVFHLYLFSYRTASNTHVGCRAACYLV